MAFTVGTEDAWTAVISTDRTLGTTQTTNGIYQAAFDLSTMAVGDTVQISVYLKIDTAQTARLYAIWTVSNVQPSPLLVTPPITCMGASCEFRLKQTAGTGRALRGRIIQLV